MAETALDAALDRGTDPESAAPAAASESTTDKLAYRLLTGPDDRAFCERVSAALADGYVLHGGPSVTFNGTSVIAAQAVVLRGGGPS